MKLNLGCPKCSTFVHNEHGWWVDAMHPLNVTCPNCKIELQYKSYWIEFWDEVNDKIEYSLRIILEEKRATP